MTVYNPGTDMPRLLMKQKNIRSRRCAFLFGAIFLLATFANAQSNELADCWKLSSEEKAVLQELVAKHEDRGQNAKLLVLDIDEVGERALEIAKENGRNRFKWRELSSSISACDGVRQVYLETETYQLTGRIENSTEQPRRPTPAPRPDPNKNPGKVSRDPISGEIINNWRPDICARSPDSFQCKFGGPGGNQTGNNNRKSTGKTASTDGTQQRPQTSKSQQAVTKCTRPPDPLITGRLRRTGIELLDTLAAMGAMTDRVLNVMGEAIVTELAYNAQPNAKVWEDRKAVLSGATRAIVDYYANDSLGQHEMLRQASIQATESILRDPAAAVGTTAVSVLSGKAVLGSGTLCKQTLRKAKDIVAAARAEKAAQRFNKLLSAREELKNRPGPPCGVNPEGRSNACAPSSWAEEFKEETGLLLNEKNFRLHEADIPTSWERIIHVQESIWGRRQFANHSPERAILQSAGTPAHLPNRLDGIISEMQGAGDGARAFVYVEYRNQPIGHMFRVGNFNGDVLFRDSAGNRGGGINFFPSQQIGAPTNVWIYRTRGADLIN